MDRLKIYDRSTSETSVVQGYRRGRDWFYDDDSPMGPEIEVMQIMGYRDNPIGEFEGRRIGAVFVFLALDEDHPSTGRCAYYQGFCSFEDDGEWITEDVEDLESDEGSRHAWDSPEAFDEMAITALQEHDLDDLSGAQADYYEVEEIEIPEEGYEENPADLTAKGERMYLAVLDSYTERGMDESAAKGLAAATVYSRAAGGAEGLVRRSAA